MLGTSTIKVHAMQNMQQQCHEDQEDPATIIRINLYHCVKIIEVAKKKAEEAAKCYLENSEDMKKFKESAVSVINFNDISKIKETMQYLLWIINVLNLLEEGTFAHYLHGIYSSNLEYMEKLI